MLSQRYLIRLWSAIFIFGLTLTGKQVNATTKVFDGTLRTCVDQEDAYRARFGLYKVMSSKIESDQESIHLRLGLAFLGCKQHENEEYRLHYRKPLGIQRTTMSGQNFNFEVHGVNLRGYRDGRYELVTNQFLTDSSLQFVDVDAPLEKVLSNEEKRELSEGKTVSASLDFWIIKDITSISDIDRSESRRQHIYGAYRVHFTLQDAGNGLDAKVTRISQ